MDISGLAREGDSRIVLLVIDGLGGHPHPETGRSELETAHLPNLDAIAAESACGLTVPIAPGITPGSGPGHLALFGYDPLVYQVGRGVMEALGIGLELAEDDVAARGNFCTVDDDGVLLDRRAGRITSELNAELSELLNEISLSQGRVSVHSVRGHRFVAVFHGAGAGLRATDTDPGIAGLPPGRSLPLTKDAEWLAATVNEFTDLAQQALRGREAQAVVLRGIAGRDPLPSFGDRYRLRPAAIAAYPMYRGLANLAGMDVLDAGDDFEGEIRALRTAFEAGGHDFFFLHYKPADSAGEDGDFEAKIEALQEIDRWIPQIVSLSPDVLVVAGDHSTPAVLAGHSWHPVPLAIRSADTRGDGAAAFAERAMSRGSLGRVPATSVMTLALAHAGRLRRFGP